ncbi:hypothetical protein [Pseudosporangium ferrugineum]|uniref:Uncharacterized protein n=1 Tax=Pseudosporangium ferrugineum TaxID=439699 RepID=A0A2T0RKH7_9ACTN|nr:hypothetical protein [Pseudosporangium ferrugineum]PRY21641.1 hypothetical protein CLV70_11962 [Pseudosporangium ferrugineum]
MSSPPEIQLGAAVGIAVLLVVAGQGRATAVLGAAAAAVVAALVVAAKPVENLS